MPSPPTPRRRARDGVVSHGVLMHHESALEARLSGERIGEREANAKQTRSEHDRPMEEQEDVTSETEPRTQHGTLAHK